MTRAVPAQLQAHLDEASTTTCRLIKIKGSTEASSPALVFGLCSLDIDIAYDDGTEDGEITYVSANGFDPTAMASDLGFSVSNAEAYALLADAVPGVTEDLIQGGALDDATWVCYLVNFKDLTAGRHIVLDAGDVGQVRVKDGTLWMPEMLSYAMRLKQPIGGVWSRSCRAVYGQPVDQEPLQTGCGVDVSALWTYGTVQSVGGESDRTFTGDFVATLARTTYPSRLQFLTGDNAGREYAVEEVDGLIVHLLEPSNYHVQVGDEYRHRRDCAKLFIEDCRDLNANELNFKGEPYIPVGDAAQGQTPGAQLPGGGGSLFTAPED